MKSNIFAQIEEYRGGSRSDWQASETPEDWELVRSEWFAITPLTGTQREHAEQMQSLTTHIGRCHYFDGAHPRMRLRSTGRIWNVQSVSTMEEQDRWLEWRLVESV